MKKIISLCLIILLYHIPFLQELNTNTIIVSIESSNWHNSYLIKQSNAKWTRVSIYVNNSGFSSYLKTLMTENWIGELSNHVIQCNSKNCNWTLQQYDLGVQLAVSNFVGIHTWEVWNEPQNTESGYLTSNVSTYFNMLKSAYHIIKNHNPEDTVLCFGGDNLYSGGITMNFGNYVWAKQLWNLGASNYCDAIDMHAYSDQHLLTEAPLGALQTIKQIWTNALNLYENLTHKPIWITETGFYSNNNIQRQATFLNQTFSFFSSFPNIKCVSWYTLQDDLTGFNYGLFTSTGIPKQSALEFEKL